MDRNIWKSNQENYMIWKKNVFSKKMTTCRHISYQKLTDELQVWYQETRRSTLKSGKLLVEKKRLIFYELTTTYLLNLKCFDAQVRSLPSTGLRNVAQYTYYKFDVDPKSLEHPSPFYWYKVIYELNLEFKVLQHS